MRILLSWTYHVCAFGPEVSSWLLAERLVISSENKWLLCVCITSFSKKEGTCACWLMSIITAQITNFCALSLTMQQSTAWCLLSSADPEESPYSEQPIDTMRPIVAQRSSEFLRRVRSLDKSDCVSLITISLAQQLYSRIALSAIVFTMSARVDDYIRGLIIRGWESNCDAPKPAFVLLQPFLLDVLN